MPFRALTLLTTLFLVLLSACSKIEETSQDTQTRLGTVRVFHSDNQARAIVFLFSDKAGWTEDLSDEAEQLAHAGAIVLGVDLPTYLANLRQSDDGCHYLISEIEQQSKVFQRQFHFSGYTTPVLAGLGEGGTLAYAALTQSPAVTIAAALAIDPTPTLDTKVPLCPGAEATSQKGLGFSYAPLSPLNGTWHYLYTQTPPAPPAWAPDDKTTALHLSAWQRLIDQSPFKVLAKPFLNKTDQDPAGLDDLPLTPLPSAKEGDTLAIILSGDGGWRDLDKTIGDSLAADDISVVGLDSLRYFWEEKKPAQIAEDLTRIINAYGALWHRPRILLIGYSFGADVLPFTYNLLAPDVQKKIGLISLLGTTASADFRFHIEDWVGGDTEENNPTKPEFAKIDKKLLQCIYGADDDEQICTDPVFDGTRRDKLEGDHHYDGNYEELAVLIKKAWMQGNKP